ncbi:MAG: cation:proton antiporter [Candidatus Nanohaloarchaea archaeon]
MSLSFEFVLALSIVYGTSYLLKFLERYEIPVLAVEILAGIIFGSVLGLVTPSTPGFNVIASMAAFGLLLIMFDAGLELDPGLIGDNPVRVAKLGALTFLLPFLSGVGLGIFLGLDTFASFLVGVTASTTSLGLVHPLLEDFELLAGEEGQLILSVTVLNDILSVVVLAYGLALTYGGGILPIVVVTAALLFFLYVAPVHLSSYLSTLLEDRIFDNTVKFSIFFAVAFAWIMDYLGVHAILGSFFAGLLIAEITHEGHRIEQSVKPVINLVAPVFFFFVGMQFTYTGFSPGDLWLLGAVTAIGLGSKMLGAYLGSLWTRTPGQTMKLLVASMPGRLSISVAAAEIGLKRGLIGQTLYDSFILLSIISVFLASLMFRHFAPEN